VKQSCGSTAQPGENLSTARVRVYRKGQLPTA